jgi:hypothetical protein
MNAECPVYRFFAEAKEIRCFLTHAGGDASFCVEISGSGVCHVV